MNYKYSLNPKIKGYVEWQLEHYHEDKRQLEQYKRDLIPSATQKLSMTAGTQNGSVSTPTEDTALRIMTNPYILTTERNIAAIDRVLEKCDNDDKKIISMVYWRQSHTVEGAGMVVNLSRRGTYKRINKILCLVALEIGLITL